MESVKHKIKEQKGRFLGTGLLGKELDEYHC